MCASMWPDFCFLFFFDLKESSLFTSQWEMWLCHWVGQSLTCHSHDWTPFINSSESQLSPKNPSAEPLNSVLMATLPYLQVSQNRPDRRSNTGWGFGEVGKHCSNPYYGHEDMASRSAPAQSSSFCNQLPECCAAKKIRAASLQRWLSNPATQPLLR